MTTCGQCTACCFAFPVVELDKPPWTPCNYIYKGKCGIYQDRPRSCKQCSCAYLQMDAVELDLRPDKCGVIFERYNQVMVGTIVGPISRVVRGQIAAFKAEGFGVMLQGQRNDCT